MSKKFSDNGLKFSVYAVCLVSVLVANRKDGGLENAELDSSNLILHLQSYIVIILVSLIGFKRRRKD